MGRKFRNDYSELAHPRVMEALTKHCLDQNVAYGLDAHSEHAAKLIREVFGAPNASVFFLAGGTQTNATFISKALRPYEAVIAASSGHINVHETGAVEATGHKIIVVPGKDGKVLPKEVEKALAAHADEHMVKPAMVYISDSTEIGTIYTKDELSALYACCKQHGLYLFVDGARLGSALTSSENDIDPSEMGRLCDAFYAGGTKNGLLFGEALVVNHPHLAADFRYHIKNQGAMLAKGYALGIQFETVFKDGLYFELARHANEMATLLKEGLARLKVEMLPSPTNQIFATFPKAKAKAIIEELGCEKWSEAGNDMTIRFVTSFATSKTDVKEALTFLEALLK
ncbi:MAG: aminotransferase class I/II-fold pyridoxal phosphate-dependent enzyme [Bacilli bacterium]|nr:aminotransferase class I/II-fold pyridoxal phosphate-dependent enzyme [Bacilli bacterium]